MYYVNRNEKLPTKNQLCLCRCPNWCSEGLQVARYNGTKFDYDDSPNDMFDRNVTAWLPLTENGVPMTWKEYSK